MREDNIFALFAIVTLITAFTVVASLTAVFAQSADTEKFAEYRKAIKKEYDIDIKNFKGKLKGGKADGKDITKYDLNQLLMGIKIEQEHTGDKMIALEISTDHLEEIPDYYTRLHKMEEDAEKEMGAKKGKH